MIDFFKHFSIKHKLLCTTRIKWELKNLIRERLYHADAIPAVSRSRTNQLSKFKNHISLWKVNLLEGEFMGLHWKKTEWGADADYQDAAHNADVSLDGKVSQMLRGIYLP